MPEETITPTPLEQAADRLSESLESTGKWVEENADKLAEETLESGEKAE